jgi:hypothetical protein
MATSVQEFLKKIGPRELTDAEARELQLLRLKEGHKGNSGVLNILAGKDEKKDDKKKS